MLHNPLFIAIDTSELQKATTIINDILPFIGGIKVGLEFFTSLGTKGIEEIKNFNKPIFTFYIALLPIILLFAAGYDWGRWVNISYVMLALIYYKLLINNHFILNFEKLKKHFFYKIKGKAFIFLFIIYCFGWNPKTVISGDVASFPGYRIPYKVFKIISN